MNSSDTAASSQCHLRGHHIQGDPAKWYSHRHPVHSLLVTSLRDPASRALSRIYWTLSTRNFKGGVDMPLVRRALTTWKDTETGCVSDGQGGFQLNYISFPTIPPGSAWTGNDPVTVKNPQQIVANVKRAMQDYDFVMVQERLEESLVALQLVMGLETSDILSMPLHVGGSYLYDRHAGCLELKSPPRLPHLSKGPRKGDNSTVQQSSSAAVSDSLVQYLDEYFQSPMWYANNFGDYVLLGAAHASLDHTIAELGQETFGQALEEFRKMQKFVLETCSKKVVFPCSRNGTIQREDYRLGSPAAMGDRYPQHDIEACIDEVVDQYYR